MPQPKSHIHSLQSVPKLLPGHKRNRGLTTSELMVVCLLFLLFVILMVPMFDRLRARSRMMQCANNLRQIGAAFEIYTIKFDGWLPSNQLDGSWRTHLDPMIDAPFIPKNWKGTHNIWRCTEGGQYYANSNAISDNRYDYKTENFFRHMRISRFPRPIRVPIVADAKPGFYSDFAIGDYQGIDYRHRGGAVILFMDWRAEWKSEGDVQTRNWWMETRKGDYSEPDDKKK